MIVLMTTTMTMMGMKMKSLLLFCCLWVYEYYLFSVLRSWSARIYERNLLNIIFAQHYNVYEASIYAKALCQSCMKIYIHRFIGIMSQRWPLFQSEPKRA
jgi:hypothetical protein